MIDRKSTFAGFPCRIDNPWHKKEEQKANIPMCASATFLKLRQKRRREMGSRVHGRKAHTVKVPRQSPKIEWRQGCLTESRGRN